MPNTRAAHPRSATTPGISWLDRAFEKAVSALCYSFIQANFSTGLREPGAPWNRTTRFVLRQHSRMPDFLRRPLVFLTLLFDLSCLLSRGHFFHNLQPEARRKEIDQTRLSLFRPFRDLIRFYETLTVFGFHSELESPVDAKQARKLTATTYAPALVLNKGNSEQIEIPSEMRSQVAVIGSGPGGAITSCLLAEGGLDVILLESGPPVSQDDCLPFSRAEMETKYRNGGVTATFGSTRVAYAEARCVGGGSEVNAGLYHRTPDEILEQWHREYSLEGAGPTEMRSHFEACERGVNVSYMPPPLPPASLKLHDGARVRGWKSIEAPRWFQYDGHSAGSAGVKQTMGRTFIPRALDAGARLIPNITARRIARRGSGWVVTADRIVAGKRTRHSVVCDSLFVCGGAIQTPALLLASGIIRSAGLRMHPSIKVVARFPEEVNYKGAGIGVHQVKEFSPRLSFGCAISSAAHLSISMLDHPRNMHDLGTDWPHMAAYYVMSTGGRGSVRKLPGFADPLVSYALTPAELHELADGLRKLCEILFAAGATALYPSVGGRPPLRSPDDLHTLPEVVPHRRTSIMTIHLSSSCPMGEKKGSTVADSFGRVHGQEALYVADASLLCTAPSVNPQGSIMAFAHRIAMHYLQSASTPVSIGSRK